MMHIINIVFLLAAGVLSVLTMYRMLQNREDVLEFDSSKGLYSFLLVAAVLVAVFVRTCRFGTVPGGFNQDGAMAAVDAKALADYGTDHYGMRWPVHLTAWGFGQMSSLLSYLMAPCIKLLGFTAVSLRLPQLIVSLLGLMVLFLFCRDAFGKGPALVVLLFAAIDPWHIMQSRWALDCNLYPHFFLFGLYFLHKSLSGRKRLWLCLSMVMFGLCMYCYGIAIYTLPVFLLMACIYLLARKKVSWGEALLALLVWLAVAWPFILVMAINFFQWDTIETPLFTLPFFPESIRSGDILFFSSYPVAQFIMNVKALLSTVLLQGRDLPWNNIPQFGSIYLFSMPFAVVGLLWLLLQLKKNDGAVLLLFFLVTGIWCGIATSEVNINRINIIFYPMIMLVGLGIYFVVCRVRIPYLSVGTAAAYLLAFSLFCQCYFGPYTQQISYYFRKDLGDAITAVKDTEADRIYITNKSWSENIPMVTEVLTLFYHETDAEYFQGKKNIENWLPYTERYNYVYMKDIDINPNEKAVYVVAEDELEFFDLDRYDIQQYGDYYVMETK